MQKYQNNVLANNGQPVANASVLVVNFATGATATIYSDNGVTVAPNPLMTDANGAFGFYAADGRYSLQIGGANVTPLTVSDILLEDQLAIEGSTGASLVGFTQTGTGAVQRTVQDELRRVVTPEQFGVKGDGVTDSTAAMLTADAAAVAAGTALVIQNPIFVSSCTLNSDLQFVGNGRLVFAGTAAVVVNGRVIAGDMQGIFSYPSTASLVLGAKVTRVPVGWFYGTGTGAVDVSYFITQAITAAPSAYPSIAGRVIVQSAGRHLLSSPISCAIRQFISFVGPGPNFRDNIDYQNSETGGSPFQYPGGDGFILAPACLSAFLVPNANVANLRISSLRLDGLTFISSNAATVTNTGFQVFNNSDGLVVNNCVFINFALGGVANGIDSAKITNNKFIENVACFQSNGGYQLELSGNDIGAQPGGIGLDLTNQQHMVVSGNNIFPDGQINIKLTGCTDSLVTGNSLQSRFVGMVEVFNGSNIKISGNHLHCYNLGNSSWTAGKGAWSATNNDPANRDMQFGIFYNNGASNCDFSGNYLDVDPNIPANSCYLRNIGGNNNAFNNWYVSGPTSTTTFVNQSGTGTQLLNTVPSSAQWTKSAGTVAASYAPAAS